MIAFSVPATAPRWQRWLVYSALARIVIFFVALAALGLLATGALKLAGVSLGQFTPSGRQLVRFALQAGSSVLGYLFLTRVIERRWPVELAPRRASGVLLGAAAGVTLISAVVGLLWSFGAYRAVGVLPDTDWWTPLLAGGLGAALSEEIIVRGVVFRISEEGLGTWWALAISALVFGGAHLFNPGATVWSALAIAIDAGVLLGMLYHVTRSLWPCIGLHAGWNFAEGTLWGVPVSGTVGPTIVQPKLSGPEWLTGGAWGAEASVVTVLVCGGAGLALVVRAIRRGTLVRRVRHGAPMMEAGATA